MRSSPALLGHGDPSGFDSATGAQRSRTKWAMLEVAGDDLAAATPHGANDLRVAVSGVLACGPYLEFAVTAITGTKCASDRPPEIYTKTSYWCIAAPAQPFITCGAARPHFGQGNACRSASITSDAALN